MRILCIANDIPLPAISGGRVDVWRRLCALRDAGHSVALLCWADAGRVSPPSEEVREKLGSVCESVHISTITRSTAEIVRRLVELWRWPSHVAARSVTARSSSIEAWARAFAPDVVFLDGLYGGGVAFSLSQKLNRPLWYRSHNIEHHYMAAQRRREGRFARRLGLLANCVGLERFERSVMAKAERVLDISQDDAAFWRREGIRHIEWLPTLVDHVYADRMAALCAGEKTIDVLYFGNLNTPNNVEAVTWLVRDVLPKVTGSALRIAVAGSRASDQLRVVLRQDHRIELIENPEDMAVVVARARVIVNPMLAGSGVNLKSVEMLFSDAALVSTPVGVAGIPDAAKACFAVAESSEAFAAAIVQGLDGGGDRCPRENARAAFSPSALVDAFRMQLL